MIFSQKILLSPACNESWDNLGWEGSICCILCGLGNEECISRPHFKEPSNWNSLEAGTHQARPGSTGVLEGAKHPQTKSKHPQIKL